MEEPTKRRFDALSILWQRAWNNFHQRRTYQWKACLAVWMTFASFIGINISGRITTKYSIYILFITIIIGLIIMVFHKWFLYAIARGNNIDRVIAIHYERIMQYISNSQFPGKIKDDIYKIQLNWGSLLKNPFHASQIGISLLFYFGAILSCLVNISKVVNISQTVVKPGL